MKKQVLYWSILILQFLVMLMINELVRLNTNEKGYTKGKWGLIQNILAINTTDKLKGKCTWICHNDTNYCKENHVKLANQFLTRLTQFILE